MTVMEREGAKGCSSEVKTALQRLADEATLVGWTTDEHGVCVHLSRQARIHFEAPQQFSLETWRRLFIHPEDRPRVLLQVDEAQAAREDFELEYRVVRSDGGVRWMRSVGTACFDAQERFRGYNGTLTDVSASHELQARLVRSEAEHRLLAENASDLITRHDAEGYFVYVSPSCEQVLGLAPQELLGCHLYERLHPDDVPVLRSELASQLHSRSHPAQLELRLRGRGGDRWMAASAKVLLDPQSGRHGGTVSIWRDISQQRQIQQRLLALHDENCRLVENSLDLICLLDHEGRFLRVNPAACRITGFNTRELVGHLWQEFVHPDDLQQSKVAYQQSRLTGQLRDFENRWCRQDGETIYLSWTFSWNLHEELLYATARDVTAHRRAKEKLQRAHERLKSLLESINDGFFAVDAEFRVTYFNSAAHALADKPQEHLLGCHLLQEAVPGLQGTVFEQKCRHAMATRQDVQFEAFHEPRDVWLSVHAYPSSEGGLSVLFHDISEHKALQADLRRNQHLLDLFFSQNLDGAFFMMLDEPLRWEEDTDKEAALDHVMTRLRVTQANPAMLAQYGLSEHRMLGQTMSEFFAHDPAAGRLALRRLFDARHQRIETSERRADGRSILVDGAYSCLYDDQGRIIGLFGLQRDTTEHKRDEQRLEHLATHDLLTGLPNRLLLNERAEALIASAALSGETLAMLLIDLDHFKTVNDSLGHRAGDQLLKMVAERLHEGLQPSAIVARLSGDEFMVVLPCARGAAPAQAVAAKLLERLGAPFQLEGQEVFVRGSIGISVYPQDGLTKETLFQHADIAMYRAKAAGRNGYRVFTHEMGEAARGQLSLESALRRALERNELELHYQPRMNVSTREVAGMEALLRWNHPQLGRVSPAQFIPLAEETGLIHEIGAWVLQQACRQNQAWVERCGRPLIVSVNLSPRQLQDPQLLEKVRRALRDSGMAAPLLELELTESLLVQNPQAAARTLGQLKELGLRVAVDDFGTGHSSLVYLKHFPLDVLKLDRAFLMECSEDNGRGKLVHAIIQLAHTMNLHVVGEGVESEEALEFLLQAGCDEAQGYHLCRPVPPTEFEQFLWNSLHEGRWSAGNRTRMPSPPEPGS